MRPAARRTSESHRWDRDLVSATAGTATFGDTGQSNGTAESRDVALGDVDGDRNLDADGALTSSPPVRDPTTRVWTG